MGILRLVVLLFLVSCSSKIGSIKHVYHASELPDKSNLESNAYLKLHLNDGRLVTFRSWELDTERRSVSGEGYVHEVNRKSRRSVDNLVLALDDCLLAETNDPLGVNVISPLIMTFPTILGIISVPCLFDPKACFGSCPTFYSITGDSLKIQAEGFSSSISSSLEATDIDHLNIGSTDSVLSLIIKNEAYETHYVRQVDVLALPVEHEELVLQTNTGFHRVSDYHRLPNPDADQVVHQLSDRDGIEYFSESDSTNLKEKETLILDVTPQPASDLGVVITNRQSLLTTFLFYQSIAYMGAGAGSLLATYEREVQKGHAVPVPIMDMLGGIEVRARIDGKWHLVGEVYESGPIASDTHLLPVLLEGTVDQLSLTMVKGLWRIDEVALVKMGAAVEPIRLQPYALINGTENNEKLLTQLNDPDQYLVNLPGTEYTLKFRLPDAEKTELFLSSTGYYIEWMREDWLREQDQAMVRMMFLRPGKWLKEMAPRYKAVEPVMEEYFWASKFVDP